MPSIPSGYFGSIYSNEPYGSPYVYGAPQADGYIVDPFYSAAINYTTIQLNWQKPGITESGTLPFPLNQNYNFDTGITPWTGVNSAVLAQSILWSADSSHSLSITGNGSAANPGAVSEIFPIVPGQVYSLTAQVISAEGWADVQFGLNYFNSSKTPLGTYLPAGTNLAADNQTEMTGSYTPTTGQVYGQLVLQMTGTPAVTISLLADQVMARDVSNTGSGVYMGEFRLIKNLYGYPVNETDGEILLDSATWPGQVYLDQEVRPGRYHYYGIYMLLLLGGNKYSWVRAGVTACLSVQDYGTGDYLYNLIPDHLRQIDQTELTTDVLGNQFLQQFMDVIAWGFDYVKTQYSIMAQINNPWIISLGDLMTLSQQMGYDFEPEIPARLVRKGVANTAAVARQRGTLTGIAAEISLVAGWDTDLTIGYNQMLENDQSFFINPLYQMAPYNATVSYNDGEYVTYGSGNYVYICLANSTLNEAPTGIGTSNAYWDVVLNQPDTTTLYNPDTTGINTWAALTPATSGSVPPSGTLQQNIGAQSPYNLWLTSGSGIPITPQLQNEASANLYSQAGQVEAEGYTIENEWISPGHLNPLWSYKNRFWGTLCVVQTQSVTQPVTSVTSVARTAEDLGSLASNPDPAQVISDGLPVPWVLDSWEYDPFIEYATGTIVYYQGQPSQALRASTGVYPPLNSEPTAEWQPIGFDKRIALMSSGMVSQDLTTSANNQVLAYPYISWYDQWGNFISEIGARGQYTQIQDVTAASTADLYVASPYTATGTTLTSNTHVAFPTVDGVAITVGQTFLLTAETSHANNGVWSLTTAGSGSVSWVATRVGTAASYVGQYMFILEGLLNLLTWYYCQNTSTPTIGSTLITYSDTGPFALSPNDTYFDSFSGTWPLTLTGRQPDISYNNTPWAVPAGSFTVDGFEDGTVHPGVSSQNIAVITAQDNCQVSVTLRSSPSAGNTQGIVFRYSDTNNYWRAGRNTLKKRVAGTLSTVATYSTPFSDNDRMTVQMNGTSIIVLRNGVNVLSSPVTDAFNSTATQHGLIVEPT